MNPELYEYLYFNERGRLAGKLYGGPTDPPKRPDPPIAILPAFEVVDGKLVPCEQPYVAFVVPGKGQEK